MARGGARSLKAVDSAFRKARIALVFAAIVSGIINVLMLTGPLYMIQVYDRVLVSQSVPTLLALSLMAAILYGFSGILDFVRTRMMVRIGAMVEEHLRSKVFDRVVEHAVRRTPNVGTQPLRDLSSVRGFLASPGPFALFDMPWVPLYIAVNALLHPLLGLVTAIAAAILFGLAIVSDLSQRRATRAAAGASVRAHFLAEEAYDGAEVLKALGMQQSYTARWSGAFDDVTRYQALAADRASLISSFSKTVRLLLQSAGLGFGAYLAVHGEITAGMIIAGSTIMSRALAPLDQAIAHWRNYIGYREAKARLNEIVASIPDEEERMPLPTPRGFIEAEGVTILAPGGDKPIIQGVSFHLPPGSGLGIVGPTGAGKSSLARALVGAWPVARGAVRLDGAKLEQWPIEQRGRAIGYLPQEIALLSGTIQENISRFEPEPDANEVVSAARMANVHEMILKLPEGYNTVLGPEGIQLSAGQRQRIALARALYGVPALLVLDEPNSNLDGDGEAALMASIEEVRSKGTTVMMIVHRPSAIRVLDHLLYIRDGRVVAFGPKDEVLRTIQGERTGRVAASGLSVVSD